MYDAYEMSDMEKQMSWKRVVRASGLIEWVCEHGVGHPDQASVKQLGEGYGIHGCDGCCGRADFPGRLPEKPQGLLGVVRGELDRMMNPLKYETELERQERHRKEDMAHQLELEKVKRTRFVKTDAAGSKATTNVSINDAMSKEFGWMKGDADEDPLEGLIGGAPAKKKPAARRPQKSKPHRRPRGSR